MSRIRLAVSHLRAWWSRLPPLLLIEADAQTEDGHRLRMRFAIGPNATPDDEDQDEHP